MGAELSYTAASTLPVKVIQKIDDIYKNERFIPYHIQICPTNLCNLSCGFCSCANRKDKEQMPLSKFVDLVSEFSKLGTRACTITGGGEPTLHEHINQMISTLDLLGIKSGLVTNGTSLHKLTDVSLKTLEWCRVSFSNDREFKGKFESTTREAVKRSPGCDWAFSYVVTRDISYRNIIDVVEFANENKFTHVRLVTDLLDLENAPIMDDVKNIIQKSVKDDIVIYQGRKSYRSGQKDCRISLIKPVISVTGEIFPCCGVQYALEGQSLDFEQSMSMGFDIHKIYEDQKPFDGSRCVKCYYNEYNVLLNGLVESVEHREFI